MRFRILVRQGLPIWYLRRCNLLNHRLQMIKSNAPENALPLLWLEIRVRIITAHVNFHFHFVKFLRGFNLLIRNKEYTREWTGGRFNTYELLSLRALQSSTLYKIIIFQCMSKIFWVEFQRFSLKCHTKYLTHTSNNFIFYTQLKF